MSAMLLRGSFVALTTAACSAIFGIDAAEYVASQDAGPAADGESGAVGAEVDADGARSDASSTAPDANDCPGTGGPPAIRIAGGGVSFCIDTTEVTKAQYAAFLQAKGGDVSGQPSRCSWNTTYVPSNNWPPVPGLEVLPVVDVDWCDAYAFCAWAGKRMCGALGGGPVATGDSQNATRSEWMYACSAGGIHSFPYGDQYDKTRCNTAGAGAIDAGSLATCVGGFPGLFDMSGNVEEWEDSCDPSDAAANDPCRRRGGSWNDGTLASNYACSSSLIQPRSNPGLDCGIRCCSP
jgi:formylglycine-generating enzyme required for sulfatase activity